MIRMVYNRPMNATPRFPGIRDRYPNIAAVWSSLDQDQAADLERMLASGEAIERGDIEEYEKLRAESIAYLTER